MVSLSFRSLVTFIVDDNFLGLRSFLESRRVQIDDKDENGTTALMVAATKGKLNFLKELLEHGADVNAEDADNWTALLFAAKEGHRDVCAELLDHAAVINHRDMGNWTALMWASYRGHTDTARVLMEQNADVNANGNFHISSLLWAAGRGHTEVVRDLLQHGAKVNLGDKYGTTALVWASRKGYTEIVDMLLKAGANVDTSGMYSWTPLLVSTKGCYVDIVNMVLEHRPNVNATDKDGCTALMVACKEGYHEIAVALLNSGSYVNLQDRNGDTNLIHASKAGHRAVVEALLKKYADIDIQGKDRKTATYWAVEKGNISTLKLLLAANPDVELCTKDGDTALMRAVRNRNVEIAQLLLEKKSKTAATDKNGDTALHIAMRARSKAIVEVLLRNPKHSQLLYRPNRSGETPYNIDMSYQKPILGQIFGARRLNTNEDNENMLGYDLYSSALADILSEPSLSVPITVGLYAKWGSGKSFLLNKLRDEMKNFARRWIDPLFQFSFLLFSLVVHISLLLGVVCGLAFQSWVVGVSVGFGSVGVFYSFFFFVWYGSRKNDWYWVYNMGMYIARQLQYLLLLHQVMFCHPPGSKCNEGMQANPVSFYFSDQTKVNNAAAWENSVVQMVGSLFDAIENDHGILPTRLYRAFRPKAVKPTSSWKWRKLCCLPYFVVLVFSFLCLLMGLIVLTLYAQNGHEHSFHIDQVTVQAVLISSLLIVGVVVIANLYTIALVVQSVLFSHRRHLQRAVGRLDTVKAEGYLQVLKTEVNLLIDMIKCLDAFMKQQTRLVVIVDGLDSCEQDKVLHVLDAVNILFSDPSAPFIIVWNIDPHKIAKAIEQNMHKVFTDSNIGPHDYLRNMVHLPFYLQNSGLRKAKTALQTSQTFRKNMSTWIDNDEVNVGTGSMPTSVLPVSPRRSSIESNFGSSSHDNKPMLPSKKSRKLKISDSVASSMASNLNRAGGPHDLTKMLLTDDYFSDVNPRSMRRLLNVVYVTDNQSEDSVPLLSATDTDVHEGKDNGEEPLITIGIVEEEDESVIVNGIFTNPRSISIFYMTVYIGRLLKAFHIDFNWYRLASWVNITEQWPYRTSWMIMYFEQYEDSLEDSMPLKTLYEKIRPQIPIVRDVDPLLEMDRDERKFDVFVSLYKSTLLIADLKVFLPFTINLDPYIRKVIKEETQNMEDMGLVLTVPSSAPLPTMQQWNTPANPTSSTWGDQKPSLTRRQLIPTHNQPKTPIHNAMYPQQSIPPNMMYPPGMMMWPYGIIPDPNTTPYDGSIMRKGMSPRGTNIASVLPPDFRDKRLSTLTVDSISDLLSRQEGVNTIMMDNYCTALRENNISGRVLLYCDLDELKKVLHMNFGDWEMFRLLVMTLRDQETMQSLSSETDASGANKNVRFAVPSISSVDSGGKGDAPERRTTSESDSKGRSKSSHHHKGDGQTPRRATKQNVLEKQVTLEEQMILGALQTLNEEAYEDVRNKEDENQDQVESSVSTLSPIQSDPDELDSDVPLMKSHRGEVEVVYLHASPLHAPSIAEQTGSLASSLPSIHDQVAMIHRSEAAPWNDLSGKPPLPPSLVANTGKGSAVSLSRTGSNRSITTIAASPPTMTGSSKRTGSLKGDAYRRGTRSHTTSTCDGTGRPLSWLVAAEEGMMRHDTILMQTPPGSPSYKSKNRTVSTSDERSLQDAESSPGASKRSLLKSLDFGNSIEKLNKLKQQLIQTVSHSNKPVNMQVEFHDNASDDSNDDGDETPLVSIISSPLKHTPLFRQGTTETESSSLYASAHSSMPLSPVEDERNYNKEPLQQNIIEQQRDVSDSSPPISDDSPSSPPLTRQDALQVDSREQTPVRQTSKDSQRQKKRKVSRGNSSSSSRGPETKM